ncbi:MAG: hypothetical protein WA364_00010, partial [Candidatus Nitrosopolaris sp.]
NLDLGKSYVFKDRKEISDYLKLAKEKTANQNFDLIFKLVKTIFKQYVILPGHHITHLVASIIYSNFQDKFATTHYDLLVGGNGSGKNSVLLVFGELAYRVLLATNVSGANIFTFLGTTEECQGTVAEDEVDSLDDDRDKKNLLKSGYSRGTSRIPKTDLNAGRKQELFHSYCYKILASESALDPSKSRGLLDRCFVIPFLVGKPKYNIKKVTEKTKRYQHLAIELEKVRKLLFACRMIHHGDTFEERDLNIFGREAELTEHLIRVFQHSPDTLNELLPALSKCLNAKREVKSNSEESIYYRAICNLTNLNDEERIENPRMEEQPNGWLISHSAITAQVRKNVHGESIIGQNEAFYCQDLAKVTHKQIISMCVAKFNAHRDSIGTGNNKRSALYFSKADLDRKTDLEYNVPDKIKIKPIDHTISYGPDNFDLLILDNGNETSGNGATGSYSDDDNKTSKDGWVDGSLGSVLEGANSDSDHVANSRIASDIKREIGVSGREKNHENQPQSSGIINEGGGPLGPRGPPGLGSNCVGCISTQNLANGAVTNPKLATGSVLSANIGAGAVATPNIADQAVTLSKLGSDVPKRITVQD